MPGQARQEAALGTELSARSEIVAKSVLVSAAPLLLFLIPMTALMWMCKSLPREKESPRLALTSSATANETEDDFEGDWDDPDQDFRMEQPEKGPREPSGTGQSR